MKNQEIARIFYEIADYLEMEEVAFKPYAYQKAASAIESLRDDIEKIYKEGGFEALEKIPGVGKSIAEKIEEYLKTGKIKYYQEFKKKLPLDLEEIVSVEGLGPKKAKILYQKLKIRNLRDLEKSARAHQIAPLFGFGEKTEKNILEGIAFLKKSKGRFLLGEILPQVKEILEKLKRLKEVEQIEPAGSIRRKKETIGDVDILITAKNPEKVMDFFVSLPNVIKIWMKGPTRSSVKIEQISGSAFGEPKIEIDVDLRVVKKKSYGSALQYFTGSKEHNIALRRIAIEKGLKLSEYGLFKGKKMIAGWNEAGIYKALGLSWIEPELREDQGEIEAAFRQAQDKPLRQGLRLSSAECPQGKLSGLPKLIDYKDIRGDLHCHSDWSGGTDSIKELAQSAMEMGYEYLGIADHTKFLRIENGLDERELAQQRKEIERLNSKFKSRSLAKPSKARDESKALSELQNSKFYLLQGCEANILNDGSIDIKDEALKKLDYVIAGVHSSFKMEKNRMTERIIKAMKNPYVDIISHPTGRILKRRDEYQIDFDKILRAAKEYKTILEINSYPKRLDLNNDKIRQAKNAGVKMVINTDAHQKDQLSFIGLGIAQARRGWVEKKDIINTYSLEKLIRFFK